MKRWRQCDVFFLSQETFQVMLSRPRTDQDCRWQKNHNQTEQMTQCLFLQFQFASTSVQQQHFIWAKHPEVIFFYSLAALPAIQNHSELQHFALKNYKPDELELGRQGFPECRRHSKMRKQLDFSVIIVLLQCNWLCCHWSGLKIYSQLSQTKPNPVKMPLSPKQDQDP